MRILLVVSLCALCGCAEIEEEHDSPGTKALDYVRSTTYSNLQIEVDYVSGLAPVEFAQKLVRGATNGTVHKTGEVALLLDSELPALGPDHAYSLDEVRALEAQYRTRFTAGDTAVMYALILDGHFEKDTAVATTFGFAYSGSAIVLFKSAMEDKCKAEEDAAENETVKEFLCPMILATTWVHEIGHQLGLVNNGVDMVDSHQDTEHGNHDTNPDCIMYWLNNSSEMVGVFKERLLSGNKNVHPFDEACLADIEAAIHP